MAQKDRGKGAIPEWVMSARFGDDCFSAETRQDRAKQETRLDQTGTK